MNQEPAEQPKQQIKDLIFELIKTQKPQNTTQLIILTHQKIDYIQEQIQGLLG